MLERIPSDLGEGVSSEIQSESSLDKSYLKSTKPGSFLLPPSSQFKFCFVMALLPHHRDSYRPDARSLPGTPFTREPSLSNYGTVGMSPRDVEEAMVQARAGIDASQDNYHHAIPRFPHGLHSGMERTPPHALESAGLDYFSGATHQSSQLDYLHDHIRR